MAEVCWRSVNDTEGLQDGERVLLCLDKVFVGEGYRKKNGKWYRYNEMGIDIETLFDAEVIGWAKMPKWDGIKKNAEL